VRDLYQRATATVFGEGRPNSALALVGEQPGDQEDKQGHPFVGPAGHVLDRALRDSDINRDDTYVTNAVKHFRWEARGKRRIHQRPNGTEIMACRGWLEAELVAVGPQVTVALGAVAGEAIFGRGFRVRDHRQLEVTVGDGTAPATIRPSSSILRAQDGAPQGSVRRFRETWSQPAPDRLVRRAGDTVNDLSGACLRDHRESPMWVFPKLPSDRSARVGRTAGVASGCDITMRAA
jgi:DNA polymerase